MPVHEEIVSVLHRNKLMRSQSEVQAFESALAVLAKESDASDLPELFLVFTDKCHQQEVMWGLLHFVESFGMENQLRAMVPVVPLMLESGQQWAKILHCRILNDERFRTYFKGLIALQPEAIKMAIAGILRKIESDDPAFSPHVNQVLSGTV